MLRRLRPRAVIAASIAVVAVFAIPPAEGAPRRAARLASTRGTGAEACRDDDALRRDIARDLGYEPFSPDASLLLSVGFTRDGGTFVAEVVASGAATEPAARRLTAPSCDQLADLLEKVLAIMIDPDPPLRDPRDPRDPRDQRDPPSEPVIARPPPPRVEPAPPEPAIALQAGVVVHAALGAAPSPAVGLVAHVGLRRGAFSIALEGRWDAPSPSTPAAARDAEIEASLLAGSVAPCFRRGVFFGCGVVSFGALDVQATGPTGVTQRRARFHAALGPRAGAAIELSSRLSGVVTLDAPIALSRAPYRIVGSTYEWIAPPVSAALGLGLVYHFL